MNKFLLLTSASILAIGVATQAGAMPAEQSTLAALCGENVDVNTAVKGTVEDITTAAECDIELSDGAKLSIKDADITLAGGLTIFGSGILDMGNSSLTLKSVRLDITSGDIIIRDSHIDAGITNDDTSSSSSSASIFRAHVGDGKIELRNNEFSSVQDGGSRDDIEITSTTGDIAAVENDFEVDEILRVESMGGNIDFKGNTGIVDNDLRIDGVEVTVKNNDIAVSDSLKIVAEDALEVKANDFSPASQGDSFVGSDNGPCDIKDNTPELASIADCP